MHSPEDIAALERRSDSLDRWLSLWIGFVVAGLFFDLFVGIHEYFAPNTPRSLWKLVGTALIVIGVSGEFVIHTKSGRVNTDMRKRNAELIAEANARAGSVEGRVDRKDAGW